MPLVGYILINFLCYERVICDQRRLCWLQLFIFRITLGLSEFCVLNSSVLATELTPEVNPRSTPVFLDNRGTVWEGLEAINWRGYEHTLLFENELKTTLLHETYTRHSVFPR